MATDSVRSSDGTTIAFSRTGAGPALITIGGALSDSSAVGPLLPFLQGHFTVHAVDRRGRGRSDDTAPYAVDREIEDLAAVVAAVGEPSYVYGHSSGAMLTLEAARLGIGATRLVVYEPPYIVDDQRPRPPEDLPQRLTTLLADDRRDDAVRLFLREGPGLTESEIAQMSAAPFWPALLSLAHTVLYDALVAGDCTLPRERFAAIDQPTLVLGGGASPEWMLAGVGAVAQTLPHARLTILPAQSHAPAPDLLSKALIGFLADG